MVPDATPLPIPTRLQLALDDVTRDDAFQILDQVEAAIDIVEVGTPLLMRYGISIVSDLDARYPKLDILCDAKIMDAADMESRLCFDAGADYVTFLALTDDLTVEACVAAAEASGGRVMADMICVPNPTSRAETLETLGVHVIAVHTGVDQQARGRTPLDDLAALRATVARTPLAVAGGINLDTVAGYLEYDPAIVIVGGGITASSDPAAAARDLRDALRIGRLH